MTNTSIEIPGYAGRATHIAKGSVFRVIDLLSCQIADMFVIASAEHSEVFSPALTRQVIFRLTPKPGDLLYSNLRRPMLRFLDDTSPGRHDMAFAPCDPEFYVALGADAAHANCRDNFYKASTTVGLNISPPPDPFNLFQNTVPADNGDFICGQSLSKAGDYVEFRAEMDIILVISACSVDLPVDGVEPIGGISTPIGVQIFSEEAV